MLDPGYQAPNLLKIVHARGPAGTVSWIHKLYATTHADVRYVRGHGLTLGGKR